MKVLVTGASGFVGRFLCNRLILEGWSVRGTVRDSKKQSSLVEGVEPIVIDPLGSTTSWEESLAGIDTVVHLAARVHIMNDPSPDPLSEFRKVNTDATERLARESAKAGVKRFVYISTIKVNGEESSTPYNENSPVHPTDPYGISKLEAEKALRKIAMETGLEVVVVRPTLVYGPGVKANFLNMVRYIHKGVPIPLALVANSRSFIYVGNLVDALAICSVHPEAVGKTYLVSDGEDVSTPELIRRIANALRKPARLFPVPTMLLNVTGAITGKSSAFRRLLGSLTVDSSKIRRELGWTPPFSMDEGLRATTEWYIKEKS